MNQPAWPSVAAQLAESKVPPGSALERLIQSNQDFHLLRPEEADDNIGVPLWLRVHWRKHHPEGVYSSDDPTGGYPRVLRKLHAWMMAHPDLERQVTRDRAVPAPPAAAPSPPAIGLAEVVGANIRISGAQNMPCNAPDIRVNYNNPSEIVAASDGLLQPESAVFYSSDWGTTWCQATLPYVDYIPGSGEPPEPPDGMHLNTVVDWTSDGTAWAVTISVGYTGDPGALRAYYSRFAGAVWEYDTTLPGTEFQVVDRQMMWVDHCPTSPFIDHIYVIYVIWPINGHGGQSVFVNRRTRGGWPRPVQVSGAETTGDGRGGDIKTNSAGDVFAFWPDAGSRNLFVAKSVDGGATFAAPVTIATTFGAGGIGVPSFNGVLPAAIYISGGAYRTVVKDLVYATWGDLTGDAGCTTGQDTPGGNVASGCKTRIWFSRSTNGGSTWESPRMLNNQASLNDQFHPRLVVDENNGRLIIVYYDTVGDPGRLQTDVWTQSSSDDGVTWTVPVRVTTDQTNETSAGADVTQYGPYIGLSGFGGDFFAVWTDRRNRGPEEIWAAGITMWARLEHVIYLAANGHVDELYSPIEGGGWTQADLTTSSGTPTAVAGSALTSWADRGYQHVIYLTADGHVHELYSPPGRSGGWTHVDLTAATYARAASPRSALSLFHPAFVSWTCKTWMALAS